MRRNVQQLPENECLRILESATSGVLALLGDEGYPYAVPISFVYTEGKIYFHSAVSGHKIDAINAYGKASFCIIEQDEVVPERYTTKYRSIIAFGTIGVVEDEAEKIKSGVLLGQKYAPYPVQEIEKKVVDSLHRMHMIRLDIEHLTGKEGMQIIRERREKEGV